MNDSEGWNRRVRRGRRNKQQKSIVTVTETMPISETVRRASVTLIRTTIISVDR